MGDQPTQRTYNGSEVARLLLRDDSFARGDPKDYPFVQKVRDTLKRFGVSQTSDAPHGARFLADEAAVNRVADELHYPRPFSRAGVR